MKQRSAAIGVGHIPTQLGRHVQVALCKRLGQSGHEHRPLPSATQRQACSCARARCEICSLRDCDWAEQGRPLGSIGQANELLRHLVRALAKQAAAEAFRDTMSAPAGGRQPMDEPL